MGGKLEGKRPSPSWPPLRLAHEVQEVVRVRNRGHLLGRVSTDYMQHNTLVFLQRKRGASKRTN